MGLRQIVEREEPPSIPRFLRDALEVESPMTVGPCLVSHRVEDDIDADGVGLRF